MVVICPRCKTKLKILDEKISPEGTRFRCPKCSSVLLVKKKEKDATEIDRNLVMVAHAEEAVVEKAAGLLEAAGYDVVTVRDGIEAVVTALRRLPFVTVIDVALPKIYGFEVCRRLKARPETEDIKVVLLTRVNEKTGYKRPPSTLYGADDYIEEYELEEGLVEKIRRLKEGGPLPAVGSEPAAPPPATTVDEEADRRHPDSEDEGVKRARRFVRTVLSDLEIYNPRQVKEAIMEGNFKEVFRSQLSEGLKLYQMRIPQEVRDKGDFFNEEIEAFMERKKGEPGG